MDPLGRALLGFAAAFVAGAINSVAGGGTLLTFPTLVWMGLPPIVANATNTVLIWPGSLGSMWAYRRELVEVETRLFALVAPSLVGGIGGGPIALEPALVERFHPRSRGLILHRPQAHDDGARSRDLECPAEPEHAFSCRDLTDSGVARGQDSPLDAAQVEARHFLGGENAII